MNESCATCACFARVLPDGVLAAAEADQEAIPVCRRNPPVARWTRIEVPVRGADGQAVINARGKPQMEAQQVLTVGYPPMPPGAICWDGWRPLGTPPGQRPVSAVTAGV